MADGYLEQHQRDYEARKAAYLRKKEKLEQEKLEQERLEMLKKKKRIQNLMRMENTQ